MRGASTFYTICCTDTKAVKADPIWGNYGWVFLGALTAMSSASAALVVGTKIYEEFQQDLGDAVTNFGSVLGVLAGASCPLDT